MMQSNNVCDYCANNGNCTESAFCYISAPGFKGIEVEQIIHCKDCEHRGMKWKDDKYFCDRITGLFNVKFVVSEEYYCGAGERETHTALYMPCSTCKNKGLPCCDDCDPPFTDYWEEK